MNTSQEEQIYKSILSERGSVRSRGSSVYRAPNSPMKDSARLSRKSFKKQMKDEILDSIKSDLKKRVLVHPGKTITEENSQQASQTITPIPQATPPHLDRRASLASKASEPLLAESRKSSAKKQIGNEKHLKQKHEQSIDVSLRKSIELLDKYDNLNEYYDDLSAKRVLHNADDDELKYKRENQLDHGEVARQKSVDDQTDEQQLQETSINNTHRVVLKNQKEVRCMSGFGTNSSQRSQGTKDEVISKKVERTPQPETFDRRSSVTQQFSTRQYSQTICEGEQIIINDDGVDLFEHINVKESIQPSPNASISKEIEEGDGQQLNYESNGCEDQGPQEIHQQFDKSFDKSGQLLQKLNQGSEKDEKEEREDECLPIVQTQMFDRSKADLVCKTNNTHADQKQKETEPCIFDDVIKTDEEENDSPQPTKSIHSPIILNQDKHKAMYYSQVNSPTRNHMSGIHSLSNGIDNSMYGPKRSDSNHARPQNNDQFVELRINQFNIEQNVLEYNQQCQNVLNINQYEPIVGESKWFEYIKDQENILDNLVNKHSLRINESQEIMDENSQIQMEKVLTVVSAHDAYQILRKAERELMSDSFNILSEHQKQKLEIITLTNLARFYSLIHFHQISKIYTDICYNLQKALSRVRVLLKMCVIKYVEGSYQAAFELAYRCCSIISDHDYQGKKKQEKQKLAMKIQILLYCCYNNLGMTLIKLDKDHSAYSYFVQAQNILTKCLSQNINIDSINEYLIKQESQDSVSVNRGALSINNSIEEEEMTHSKSPPDQRTIHQSIDRSVNRKQFRIRSAWSKIQTKNKRIRMISAYEKDVAGGIKSKPGSPKMRKSQQCRSSMSNNFANSFRKDQLNSQKNQKFQTIMTKSVEIGREIDKSNETEKVTSENMARIKHIHSKIKKFKKVQKSAIQNRSINEKSFLRNSSAYNKGLGVTKKEFSTRKFQTFLDQYYTNQHEQNQKDRSVREKKSQASTYGDKTIIKNGDLYVQKRGKNPEFDLTTTLIKKQRQFNTIQQQTNKQSSGSMQPRGFRRDWKNSYRTGNLSIEATRSPKTITNRHRIYGDHRLQAAMESQNTNTVVQEFNSECYMQIPQFNNKSFY